MRFLRQVQDLLIVLDEVGLKIVVKMGVTFQVPSYWSRHLDLRAMIRIQLFLVEFPRVSLFLDHGAGFLKINFSPFYFKCASTPNSSARIKTNSCSKY
jgi:hypothetical protein